MLYIVSCTTKKKQFKEYSDYSYAQINEFRTLLDCNGFSDNCASNYSYLWSVYIQLCALYYWTTLNGITVERIRVNPTVQVAAVGDDVTFECTVTNIPPFIVTWLSDRSNVSKQSSLLDSENGIVTLRLTLTNVTNKDYHTYTCSAVDRTGTIFASKFAVLGKLLYC